MSIDRKYAEKSVNLTLYEVRWAIVSGECVILVSLVKLVIIRMLGW